MAWVLPKWLMVRYCKLWAKYRTSPFTYTNAKETLDERDKVLSVVLSNLKLKGWLKVDKDKNDARKRIYFLLNPVEIMENIAKMKTKDQRDSKPP